MSYPQWTVLYNIVSEESDKWVGTGWEFFDDEAQATKCYERQIKNGNCPTKRPFYSSQDAQHLGAVHNALRRLTEEKSTGMLDENGAEIFVGDTLHCVFGYKVIVQKDHTGVYGKLICDPKDSCAEIPYNLNTGKGYFVEKREDKS